MSLSMLVQAPDRLSLTGLLELGASGPAKVEALAEPDKAAGVGTPVVFTDRGLFADTVDRLLSVSAKPMALSGA